MRESATPPPHDTGTLSFSRLRSFNVNNPLTKNRNFNPLQPSLPHRWLRMRF